MIPFQVRSRGRTGRALLATAVLCAFTGSIAYGAAPQQAAPQQNALRDLADARGVQIGAAVAVDPLTNENQYRTILNREFNAVTPENELKWDTTEPSQGQFNFSSADAIVDNATSNGQQVHGHTLVWYNQTPSWVEQLNAEQLAQATRNHISKVVGRYAGKIKTWDVVNEMFNEDGTRRDTVWQQKLGDNHVAQAFRWAHQADPKAKLYINDYNVEGINDKSDALYELVKSLKQQGVPIHGVGLQSHFIVGQLPSDLQKNIQRFADLGLDVKITELDVRIQTPADQQELQQQKADYRAVTEACLAVKRCKGVTAWGITDKHSWVPDTFPGYGAALPYTENYEAKPAYDGLRIALGGAGATE